MKKNRPITIGVLIISILAVIGIVASLLNLRNPGQAAPAATNTPPPQITSTPDPCAKGNIQASVAAFEKTSREFDDQINLARNTANSQLAPIISNLQAARRNVDDYQVPACMDTLKADLLGYMNSYIDFYLTLYSSASVAVPGMTKDQYDQTMAPISARANQQYLGVIDYTNKFLVEKARLLGATPPALVPTALIVQNPAPAPAEITSTP